MDLQERLILAQEAGPEYLELSSMFEAAITKDQKRLTQLRKHESAAVRFASYVNPLTNISRSDLTSEPLVKFAAIHNPRTSTEILDQIGLNQIPENPVLPEFIHKHKNVSKEFQAIYAIAGYETSVTDYNNEEDKYFDEAVYGESGLDAESLESLVYMSLLNLIPSPRSEREYWADVLEMLESDQDREKVEPILQMFGRLPAIPGFEKSESERWDSGAQVLRSIAGEISNNYSLIDTLRWDRVTLNSNSYRWNESRSPRASIGANQNLDGDYIRNLFLEESKSPMFYERFPNGLIWRLSRNPNTPEDVLTSIVGWIEDGLIKNVYAPHEILVGSLDGGEGLFQNPSVKGELRKRVKALMKDKGIDPKKWTI